ncbi:hypothetical protein GGQ92_001900 [Gracilibacillus halotolerans]|uniref:Glutaredoxin domain-containing protein n=1 Tax=Gracilibacillus halotolerans TaxID=74386 RepID=A0A841RG66_9BACI|nr:glutaredoxin domain-containing protein [Gracilibacillus halotolerans]MBB6513110.1 hypothetical protein [Gracilibacillus halotolerans]
MKFDTVEVYISDDCGNECNEIIQFFKNRGIPYFIKNISKDKSFLKKLREQDVYITPVVFYGESEYILGYQQSKLEEIFGSFDY